MQINEWLQIIAGAAYRIAVGRYWRLSFYNATLESSANFDLLYRTGAASVNITSEVSAGGACTIQTFEGATVTGEGYGTPVTPQNVNRNHTTAPLLLAYHTPSLATTGASMRGPDYLPGGEVGGKQGSNLRAGTGWILQPNTIYLLRVTNVSNGSIKVSISQEFCEG